LISRRALMIASSAALCQSTAKLAAALAFAGLLMLKL